MQSPFYIVAFVSVKIIPVTCNNNINLMEPNWPPACNALSQYPRLLAQGKFSPNNCI